MRVRGLVRARGALRVVVSVIASESFETSESSWIMVLTRAVPPSGGGSGACAGWSAAAAGGQIREGGSFWCHHDVETVSYYAVVAIARTRQCTIRSSRSRRSARWRFV